MRLNECIKHSIACLNIAAGACMTQRVHHPVDLLAETVSVRIPV